MKTKQIYAAAIFLAASATAFAQEFVQADASVSNSKTRAEVIAELEQARADGSLAILHSPYTRFDTVSTRSRAEVIAELKQAREAGTLEFRDAQYPFAQAERRGGNELHAETASQPAGGV